MWLYHKCESSYKTMAHKIYANSENGYWRVCDPLNVLRATNNTLRGKMNRHDVKRLLRRGYCDAVTNVWEMLEKQTFKPSKYTEKTIFDVKQRNLKIAPLYPDRIVHHCLIDVIEEDLRKIFIANTYACIKGRGIHKCLTDLNRALQKDKAGTKYCLKIDVRHYYDSIVHSILKDIIAKSYGDKKLLWLMHLVIDSTEGDIGLPIGFLTSQHFANWYLSPFDHLVKEVLRVRYYYRYMDDIVILANSKAKLHYILEQVREYLQTKLRLTIKANWQIFPVDARSIDFVGYKSNHYNILARKSILYTYWRKLKRLQNSYGVMTESELRHKLSAHFGWLQHCSSKHYKEIVSLTLKQIRIKQMEEKRLSTGLHSDSVQPTFDVIDRAKGTTLYNFNQHYEQVDDEQGKKRKVNVYDSLLCYYPITANTVLETLIMAKYSDNLEKKLLNDYNAAVAGIEDESKKQPYLDFLAERKALRAMVDADCATNNIPME